MIEETWTTVAVPILEAVHDGERGDARAVTLELLARSEADVDVRTNLTALVEDGYLDGASVTVTMGDPEPVVVADLLRLTPRGRRAVGQWPSGEAGDVLIRTLEAAVARAPEGETRTRLQRLLTAARDVGVDVLTGVVSSVVKGTMGLPSSPP